jgi:uncharacterized protein YcfJ
MMGIRKLALVLPALAAGACVTTSTTSSTWGPEAGPPRAAAPLPDRPGRVEWVRETVTRQQGNPAGGAAVGAVVGGILGHAITGDPGGALVGADIVEYNPEQDWQDVTARVCAKLVKEVASRMR